MSNKRFLEFSKPFINATKGVFETMVFSKIAPSRPSIKQDTKSRGDVSAIMGINGSVKSGDSDKFFRGMLVFSWPYETYLKIASSMLMETFTEFNAENADVGAEIANMVMGNAKRDLRELGYKVDMAIPSMISGKDHCIVYPQNIVIVLIPLVATQGEFFMELCYTE